MLVRTPAGQAREAEGRLRKFLLGITAKPTVTGFQDDSFFWEMDVSVKAYFTLQKKAIMFSNLAGGVVGNKVFKGAAERLGATKAQLLEVEDMLRNGTSIEIVKTAKAEEVVEGGMTYWESLKAKFSSA